MLSKSGTSPAGVGAPALNPYLPSCSISNNPCHLRVKGSAPPNIEPSVFAIANPLRTAANRNCSGEKVKSIEGRIVGIGAFQAFSSLPKASTPPRNSRQRMVWNESKYSATIPVPVSPNKAANAPPLGCGCQVTTGV